MKITLSGAFKRRARKIFKRNPLLREPVATTIKCLQEDPFDPALRTHKLKGVIGAWSCSVAYDLRIVFEIEKLDNEPMIVLQSIGTHDEVY